MMTSARRFALGAFLGVLLIQVAWIFAVPPYRAIDEFDHVYRAAGVAQGQWVLTEDVDNGRGLAVSVPPEIVREARPQCEALPYTEYGNCNPVETLENGLVVVATAAGPYNPAYYAVIGYAAKPFDGVAAGYVMRFTSALLCAGCIALAAYYLGLMGAGGWTRIGLYASLTPMLVYTTAIPAPNSIEIVTALVVWAALTALGSGQLSGRHEGRAVVVAGIFAGLTALPRTLGPLWLLLIGLTLLLFFGVGRLREIWSLHRARVLGGCVFTILCGIASAAWSSYAGLFGESPDVSDDGISVRFSQTLEPVVWTLQLVGAFPFRGQPAPVAVYMLFFLVMTPLLIAALRIARGKRRLTLVFMVGAVIFIPIFLTAATFESQGVIWQGRYQLPFVVGCLVLCGLILDSHPPGRLALDGIVIGGILLTAAQAWSVAHVALIERARDDIPFDAGVFFPVWLLTAVAIAGGALLSSAAWAQMRQETKKSLLPIQDRVAQ
jgi:hypothetical protein